MFSKYYKKTTFLLVLVFSALFYVGIALAQVSEAIKNFDVNAQIQRNGTVLVQESIVYDFGENWKHGIYRDTYSKGINIKVKIVQMDDREVKYEVINSNDNVRVKIGDPDQTILGVHTYSIIYSVKGAVRFLSDHDEFYWNVTGNGWIVPIEAVSAAASIEGNVSEKDIQLKCYTGVFGSLEQNCFAQLPLLGCEGCKITTATFEVTKPLWPGEGLTVMFGWPKGVVVGPSVLEKISDFFLQFGFWFLPIIIFIYLFQLWWRKGMDIKLHKTIIAQYELPNDLRPAEVGYILRQQFSNKDLSATIIDLAVRGYLKIQEKETKILFFKQKDWELIKLKDFRNDESLEPYEEFLLEKIFEGSDNVLVASLKKEFYKNIKELKNNVSVEMVLDDYFVSDPGKAQKKFAGVGIAILVIFYIFVEFINKFAGFFASANIWLPFLVSGILFFIFGIVMPKKTLKGTELLWQIKGFKEYIKTAERYRVQFQEKENIFEKYLPYAIVFGLTKKWAKAFEGIVQNPPNWYVSATPIMGFSPASFSSSLDKSLASISTAMGASPSGGRGGGGFSGGGGGGGGGGSW